MDRKPPALTSPWKVGFLVALMLTVTGLGVGYFISGTFGLKWTWIEFGGTNPTTWRFSIGAFATEMLPLILIVMILALASYVLVKGAVQRYTRYVDSGVEYKQLLRTIKTVDDLEDEERMEKLKQHPELREFLLGFKNRMAAREKQLIDREKRDTAAREATNPMRNLGNEVGVVVAAIGKGRDGFTNELEITIPEMKQIERAVREQLAKPVPAEEEVVQLRQRLEATLDSLRRRATAVRRESEACLTGTREMEDILLGELKRSVEAQDPGVATDGIAKAAKQLDAMADALTTLGEETRRVAIAAALEASGGAPEGNRIQVADEIRAIATRFNAVAAKWKETGPSLRAGVGLLEKGLAAGVQRRAALAAVVSKAASKAQRWGERLVALQEQVRELERAMGGTPEEAPSRPRRAAAPEPETNAFTDSLDDAFETSGSAPHVYDIDTDETAPEETMEEPAAETPEPAAPRPTIGPRDIFEPAPALHTKSEESPAGDDDFGLETGSPPPVFEKGGDEEEAPFADIPGFEKERRVFNARPASEPADDDAGLEVEHDGADAGGDSTWSEVAGAKHGNGDDEFLTGPRASEKPAKPETKPAPATPRPAKAASPFHDPDAADSASDGAAEDDGSVDLYEIGAVDFVEGVHA